MGYEDVLHSALGSVRGSLAAVSAFAHGNGTEIDFINALAIIMISLGILSFVSLQLTIAPYGRYSVTASAIYGFMMNGRLAWFLQEVPCVVMAAFAYAYGEERLVSSWANRILFGMFIAHYINRALIYPVRMRGGKPTPFGVFFLAFIFCIVNGYMQTRYVLSYAEYDEEWIYDPRFIAGVNLFIIGMRINMQADDILRNLRKPGESGYKIPKGGMFDYVSGANFFGEILEWTGFAIASWSLVGTAFALFTFCNIGPRALHHHQWYKQKFEDYPKSRKALIPFFL